MLELSRKKLCLYRILMGLGWALIAAAAVLWILKFKFWIVFAGVGLIGLNLGGHGLNKLCRCPKCGNALVHGSGKKALDGGRSRRCSKCGSTITVDLI